MGSPKRRLAAGPPVREPGVLPRAHVRTSAAIVLLALLAGCGGDEETTRDKPSRPPLVGPAPPTMADERPAAPAVPDGGLDQGHGVDDQ
jgi:hypothetical protein